MRPQTMHGRPRPHLLYMHTEKTGGSSIECATQGQPLVRDLVFTNLGHTQAQMVERCKVQCVHDGVEAQTIITVREPFSWWRSLYRYGYEGRNAAIITNKNFAGFMADAARNPQWAQSSNIRRACGRPCTADHYLHTESLEEEWLRLMVKMDLPLVALPHTNPTLVHSQRRKPDRTNFTREIVEIIYTIDSAMFDEFGYPRRAADVPFELA